MASLPATRTKSRTRVYRVRDCRSTGVPGDALHYKTIHFRGHTWDLEVWRDRRYLFFRVTAAPRSPEYYAQTETIYGANITIEILDENRKPVAFKTQQLVEFDFDVCSYWRPSFFGFEPPVLEWYIEREEAVAISRRELEMSSCVHDNEFIFRCTVSEDGVPLGTFAKLRSRVAAFFSKHQPARVYPE